jgi:RNA polymerase sigma-70 factor (ECF subfamily)
MTVDEFQHAFGSEIEGLVARIERRYSVSDAEITSAVHSSARKYLADKMDQVSGGAAPGAEARKAATEFLSTLNADDLCLATACAKGDDAAWEDFFREYRSYLVSIARTMTQDAGAAEQLADSTFAELYGLRESGGARISKFSFYSGRGSLRGWLRAVVFQLSADHHRQSSRLVQTEEPEDMDRLAQAAEKPERRVVPEPEFIRERYSDAVAQALRAAMGDLEPRERLLLAYYYYDEMTLRQIGQLFEVHEATISRWLTKVQKRLRKLVEKGLARDHRFNRREVAEAIALAAEQMNISVGDYLLESVSAERKLERPAETAGGAIAQR